MQGVSTETCPHCGAEIKCYENIMDSFWADIVVDVPCCLSENRVADLGLDKWLETDTSLSVLIIICHEKVLTRGTIGKVYAGARTPLAPAECSLSNLLVMKHMETGVRNPIRVIKNTLRFLR